MKVLMVLSHPYGVSAGTDARVRGLCEGLKKLKVEVRVVVPSKALVPPNRVSTFRLLGPDKLHFREWGSSFLMSRTARLLMGEVVRAIDAFEPDIIQLEQDTAGLIAPALKRRTDSPIVMDFHGIRREESIASDQITQSSFFYKWLTKKAMDATTSADAVTVVSEEMRVYVMRFFDCDESKVYVVPNAAIPRLESKPFRERTNRVIFAGTVASRENIPLLAEALIDASNLNPSLEMRISNRGDSFSYLHDRLARAGIKVSYDWVTDERYPLYVSESDIGLIPALNHGWRQMATPAKLYDYLAAGVAVVATDIGAGWNSLIRDNKVGVLTENNPRAFSAAILELCQNPEIVHEMGNRAISLVRSELNYDNSASKLLQLYNRVLDQ
ncbi:MAG: glycosyltransferase family 4 protein [Nitrososphaerales archaeon]|jgi:glycosyltransferase involved in cell wall biosynthesis